MYICIYKMYILICQSSSCSKCISMINTNDNNNNINIDDDDVEVAVIICYRVL